MKRLLTVNLKSDGVISVIVNGEMVGEIDGEHPGFPKEWFVRFYGPLKNSLPRPIDRNYETLREAIGRVVQKALHVMAFEYRDESRVG